MPYRPISMAWLGKDRKTKPSGENSRSAKLNVATVREIKATRDTVSGKEWARRLGVSTTTVYNIRNGVSWSEVTEDG